MADGDPRTVGPTNCLIRRNIRREDDAEVLMPGWKRKATLPAECVFLFRAERPNGDRAVLAFTETAIYRLNGNDFELLKDGFTASSRWEAVSIDGWVLFNNSKDLPHSWDWVGEVTPVHEMREQGIIRVHSMWTAYNFVIMADIEEFTPGELPEWMNGSGNPYGNVPAGRGTRTPYRIIWTDRPLEWGVTLNGARINKGTSTITLPFGCESLNVGDKLNFVQTEGEGTAFLTEAVITEINNNRIKVDQTLDIAAVEDGTAIRGMITRSSHAQRMVGYDDLQGDGSTILGGGLMGRYLYIYRETEIIIGEITDNAKAPFLFQPVFRGLTTPTTRELVTAINQDTLFYYSRGGWYQFDIQTQKPRRLLAFDASNQLFKNVDPRTSFIVDVPPEEEVWIFLPDRTMVFDYGNGLFTEIDAVFTSAALIDGDDQDRVLLLADQSSIFQQGGYDRDGESYTGVIVYGYMGTEGNLRDMVLRRYFPLGHGGKVIVSLDKYRKGSETPSNIVSDKELGLGIGLQAYIRSPFIQDTIKIPSTEHRVRLTGREIEQYNTENRLRGAG